MIKKQIFLVLMTTILWNTTFSQVEISGQVKDNVNKKPLSFCTIKILNNQDSVLKAVSTNDKGFFTVNTKRGNYVVAIECLGYKTDSIKTTANKDIFLGNIFLQTADQDIDEVVVKAAITNNMLDKDVVTVTGKLKQGAANTQDVLAKVSGIQLDRYNNTLKVDNDANIIILVDGLKKDQKYIKNLAPDRLQKIEIIRDPGGRYGLEGYSAVINIILKSDYNGYEIYLSNFSGIDTDNPANMLPLQNNSIDVNYTIDKLNIYASADYWQNSFKLKNEMSKKFYSGLTIDKNPPTNESNLIATEKDDDYNLGIDYKINPKHTISLETSGGGFFSDERNTNNSQNVYKLNDSITKIININSQNNSQSKFFDYDLFYVGKINSKLSLDIDFYNYYNKKNFTNLYSIDDSDSRTETGVNNVSNMKFYSEANYSINQKSALQFGYGFGRMTKNTNSTIKSNDINLPGTNNPTNNFEYSDIRNKLYSYFSHNFNKKIGLKIGLAAEISTFKASGQTENFISYRPFFNLKYQAFSFLNIRLKYRSYTNYPNLNQTNPIEYIIDNESVSKGNPNLLPSVKHRISTRFNIFSGLASLEPYYKFSQNQITQIATLRNDGLIEYGYDNAGAYNRTGIKAGLTIPFAKFLIMQNNANIFKENIKYNGNNNNINDWSMNSQLIYMNEKLNTVAGLVYQKDNAKRITAQGYSKQQNDLWGVFFQQPFFKKRLNVMIAYLLPINWGTDNIQVTYEKTNTYTQENKTDASILQNVIMINVSYRFQKGITRKKQTRNKDNNNDDNQKSGLLNF